MQDQQTPSVNNGNREENNLLWLLRAVAWGSPQRAGEKLAEGARSGCIGSGRHGIVDPVPPPAP